METSARMKEGERPIAGMSKNEWIEGQKQGWIRTKTKGRDCNADKLEGISEEKRVGGRVVVDRRVWPDGETGAKRERKNAATQPAITITSRFDGEIQWRREAQNWKAEVRTTTQHRKRRNEGLFCFLVSVSGSNTL